MSSANVWAQQNVGIGTTTPNASAALDVESTNQGFLPPRLSLSEMLEITSPAEGLVVYNTDLKNLSTFNGDSWMDMTGVSIMHEIAQYRLDTGETPKQIFDSGLPLTFIYGTTYKGGLIAYLDTVVGTGIIVAHEDQSGGAPWGCYGGIATFPIGTSIGTGQQNTSEIVTGCHESGIAAKLCDNYSVSVNGTTYSDWFLPSMYELIACYSNLKTNNLGNFASAPYWSSTQLIGSFLDTISIYMNDGLSSRTDPRALHVVRAVRYF
jgi:hypothetical protein